MKTFCLKIAAVAGASVLPALAFAASCCAVGAACCHGNLPCCW